MHEEDELADRLDVLRDPDRFPHVRDVRQRGLMVGIELCTDRSTAQPFDFTRRTGTALCQAMRSRGVLLRPLGDVIVLMPIPAMPEPSLHRMLDVVIETLPLAASHARHWTTNITNTHGQSPRT